MFGHAQIAKYTCVTTHCSMLQHTATHNTQLQQKNGQVRSILITPHNTATQPQYMFKTRSPCHSHASQHTATPPSTTLQHPATHCNTLQHTATHLQHMFGQVRLATVMRHNTLQHLATHCNTMQHTCNTCLGRFIFP